MRRHDHAGFCGHQRPDQVDSLLLNTNRATVRGYACGCSPDTETYAAYSSRIDVKVMAKTFPLEGSSQAYDGAMANRAQFCNGILVL